MDSIKIFIRFKYKGQVYKISTILNKESVDELKDIENTFHDIKLTIRNKNGTFEEVKIERDMVIGVWTESVHGVQ